jgi:uncharacterized cupredoxin-like copper-binding protein
MRCSILATASLTLLIVVLAACGKAPPAGSADRGLPIPVTLTDFRISSSATTFKAGQAYHFIVANHGQATHEFMIMPTSEGPMDGMSMEDMDHMALANAADFPPGQIRTLTYTFPGKMTGAHPEFACYVPGHYELGMHLDVTVIA